MLKSRKDDVYSITVLIIVTTGQNFWEAIWEYYIYFFWDNWSDLRIQLWVSSIIVQFISWRIVIH